MTITDTERDTGTATNTDIATGATNVFERLVEPDELRIELHEGELVCVEGDAPDTWWYVVEGFADVTRDGRYLATIGPDETIGEISMLDGRPRTATVTAASDLTLLVGSADELLAALEASPALALVMARQVASRFRDLSEQGTRAPVAPAGARDDQPVDAPISPSTGRVEFNPFEPNYFDDPHVQMGRIREREPVHLVDLTGAYMFTRYEHVQQLARDRRLGVDIAHALPNPSIDAERAMLAAGGNATESILRIDGDDHAR